jgi:hypothetical protein
MNIDIEKEGTTLRAHVELPAINPDTPYSTENKEIWVSGTDVIEAVQRKSSVKDGWACIESPLFLHNLNERTRIGTWVFEKKQKASKTAQKTNSDTRTTKPKSRSSKK